MKINLQEQLINLLTSDIQNLPANAKLPSERQLADRYEVSRNTVRSALLNLEAMALVRRVHGKGTFVNRVSLDSDLGSSFKFDQQMALLGKVPSTKVVNFEIKDVNAYFAQNMNLELGEMMIRVDRLRLADGEPMMLERSFLPQKVFSTLSEEMLQDRSMYDVFYKDFNEKISYADEYFSAGVISDCDTKLEEGTPCLRLKRKTYDVQNRIIEFTLSVARSDKFSYHVRHTYKD